MHPVLTPARLANTVAFVTALSAITTAAADETLIPVVIVGDVQPAVVKVGEPIPLAVTITNGLKGPLTYSTFSLQPNDWNGETLNLTLVDVYRNGQPRGLFAARPKVEAPPQIAGPAAHRIPPGESLTVTTDARKWKIAGDWVAGKYKVNVRVERLTVDGGRCVLSVYSEPFEFEIR